MSIANPLLFVDKLVFSGGGLRGCVHIGVIKFLEEIGLRNNIKYVIGTSIGSLIALLFVLSYTASELDKIIKKFDYGRCQSFDVCHILDHFGIDTFEKITEFIASLLSKKNVGPYITFGDLFKLTHKHLIINAVCLNTHENTIFDHVAFPEMPVIVAIKASMSLPVIFGSVKYNNLTYVDGGLLHNFMIDLPIIKESPKTVLGINLRNTTEKSVKNIESLDQYAIHLIICLYGAYIRLSECWESEAHIVNISTPNFNTFDLMLGNDDKSKLIEMGYIKMKEYYIKQIIVPQKAQSEPIEPDFVI